MNGPPPQAWLNALLSLIQQAQLAMLRIWHALGWTGELHGQPAWPWAQRIAGETLLIDLGLARQLALTLIAVALAVACALAAAIWKRHRLTALAIGALALTIAPWPSTGLLLTPAAPTSFHISPSGFAVTSIATGARVYAQHCAACHGDDGRGEGRLSATLVRWPPTFASPLLGRRAEGELFWHIAHGMRDARGHATMPAFAAQLSDTDTLAVIDYMNALAAGTGAAQQGSWPIPLRLPEVAVRCGREAPRALSQWRRGQRVRVVMIDGTAAEQPFEDPRFLTLLVTPDGRAPGAATQFRADCVAESADAWRVYALIAGVDAAHPAGTTLLADRQGWLRARADGKRREWSDADLLCTAGQQTAAQAAGTSSVGADGLTALLLRIDAEPVRFVQGGFVH